jgi:anaerobic magnesium-protoporphyrin IX monomethyl ester cyclase
LKKKLKVCLIYPRFKIPTGDPPLGLAYLASSLRARTSAEVRIIDATFHPAPGYVISALKELQPDITGIYSDTPMHAAAVGLAKTAKQLGSFVVAGGPHPTLLPETAIDSADLVVIGEGERALPQIVERFADKDFKNVPAIWYKNGDEIIKTPAAPVPLRLDDLPLPAFDLLEMPEYIRRWHYLDCFDMNLRGTNIIGSRGCPFNCTYCQPSLRLIFGPGCRYRSAENILEEIQYLQRRYGLNAIFFHDDTLTANRPLVETLCAALARSGCRVYWGCNTRADTIDRELMEKMHAAGLRKFHLGIESGSQRILDEIYRKKTNLSQVRQVVAQARQAGIRTFGFFILGAPTETRSELKQTIKLANSLALDEASFSILTPMPKTRIHDLIAQNARYRIARDLSLYNYYSKRVYFDPDLPDNYIKLMQLWALILFYTSPKRWRYLLKHFTSLNGLKKLIEKIRRSL